MTEDRSIKPNDVLYIVFEIKEEEVDRLCGRGYLFRLWLVSERIGLPVWTKICITGKLKSTGHRLEISGTIEVDEKGLELYFIGHLGKLEGDDKAKYAGAIKVSKGAPCLSFAAYGSGRTIGDARRDSVSAPSEHCPTARAFRDARRPQTSPPAERQSSTGIIRDARRGEQHLPPPERDK